MTRLTEEMVIARSKQSDLSSIKKLNCWGSELSDVSIIKRMRGVEVLALSVNKINSLQHFEDCRNLQELYLRKNNIQDISEIVYLQNLPRLKYLWLEENPCCDSVGPSYRAVVLRALPNLKKLDNVEVTPEEVEEALNGAPAQVEEEEEDSYEAPPQPSSHQQQQQKVHHQQQQQQQTQQQHYQQQQQQSQQQQYSHQQQQQQQYASQQRRSSSPIKENSQHISPDNTEESLSETNNQGSVPSSPLQRSPTNHQDYSPPEQAHPPSPKYNQQSRENRLSYTQYDQRSPGSDQESPLGGYRERGPIPPSISTHSMKEYYQSDRPSYPAHYRHSQTDLTEWEEHQQHNNQYSNGVAPRGHPMERRSAGAADREISDRYNYRNGNVRENGDWEDREERPRTASRRPEGRFNDSASVVSTAVLNHYSYHRRPINRSSNLLSATLCLVKELDYPSLEVVEHAVRCRIDELSAE
ncbi:myb-like protein I isoform X1 [Episyrphus balteatus]|uniref:myb-like protein I isoform X1 n=1 Tax=Episyrphus balteatus TaxID=286459 RepID=UPI0024869AFC|nr:myb-like protein I isoform X1 [Episyrphus balteatus]XP_055842087.1 myb-like protein I isoform X1 [Episyrphus balteatus]